MWPGRARRTDAFSRFDTFGLNGHARLKEGARVARG